MGDKFNNVWDALFEDHPEKQSLKIKSELMIAIEKFIKEEGITQQQAANRMGVAQPRISDIVRGKLDRFTIDMLVDMLAKVQVRLNLSSETIKEDKQYLVSEDAHSMAIHRTVDTAIYVKSDQAFPDHTPIVQQEVYETHNRV